ncbi:MAG: lipoate--protein ligase family protein [Candidatus Heimdallarchaeota archaeon]|nr:MAG: lipoate--protein ligase family protein [Candidatus Heimdallarchaeota archaeon]
MKDLNWRLLNFSVNYASMNMAIDEAIFRCFDGINTLRLYGWKPSAVSIGKHQKISEEVNLNSLREFNFDCVRRISGGGAVFHDEGELTYSIVTNLRNIKEDRIEGKYYKISEIIFQPLEKLGLTLNYDQIHCPSVFSNGKKISGNAQARNKDIVLQHGTILVKFRPKIMYSVLKAREGRTRESMVESVYQHVTTLTESLKKDMSPGDIADYLIHYLTKTSLPQSYIGELTVQEQQMAEELASNKYESEDWLYKYR